MSETGQVIIAWYHPTEDRAPDQENFSLIQRLVWDMCTKYQMHRDHTPAAVRHLSHWETRGTCRTEKQRVKTIASLHQLGRVRVGRGGAR